MYSIMKQTDSMYQISMWAVSFVQNIRYLYIFFWLKIFPIPPVSMTPVVLLELPISPRIFEKIRTGQNGIPMGLEELIHAKKWSRKSHGTIPLTATTYPRGHGFVPTPWILRWEWILLQKLRCKRTYCSWSSINEYSFQDSVQRLFTVKKCLSLTFPCFSPPSWATATGTSPPHSPASLLSSSRSDQERNVTRLEQNKTSS
jgi:hypothetical protein